MDPNKLRKLVELDASYRILAMRFNFQPFSLCHPEQLQRIFNVDKKGLQLLTSLESQPRFRARINRLILKRCGLVDNMHAHFVSSAERMTLGAPEVMFSVAQLCGVFLHFSSLNHLIMKADIQAVLGSLGMQGLRQAAAIRRDFSDLLLPPMSAEDASTIARAVRVDGRSCFADWLRIQPQGLRLRTLLRFPVDSELAATGAARRAQLYETLADQVFSNQSISQEIGEAVA